MLLLLHLFLLTLCITLPITTGKDLLKEFREELAFSQKTNGDQTMSILCDLLASPEFVKASEDDSFLTSVLYEVGFGVLGVKPNSWAARYQADSRKTTACFAALHSAATSELTQKILVDAKKIIRRCCMNEVDL